MTSKVPVTVITGTLGAGKTTLIQNILRGDHGYKVAVIQNEVSEEMGIESPALTDGSGSVLSDFYELPIVCVCCSAKDGLLVAIEELVERSITNPLKKMDAILVETTGVADPSSLAQLFWVDEEAQSGVYLNGIVTIVDSLNIMKLLQTCVASDTPVTTTPAASSMSIILGKIATKQIVSADALIINKVDQLGTQGQSIEDIKSLVSKLNQEAKVIVTEYSKIPIDWLFNINAYKHALPVDVDRHHDHHEHTSDCQECHQDAKVKSADSHGDSHFLGIDHVMVKTQGILSKQNVEQWIGKLLWSDQPTNQKHPQSLLDPCSSTCPSSPEIYRCKGLFRTADDEWMMLQGVGEIFEVVLVPRTSIDTLKGGITGTFLFVGTNLSKDHILSSLVLNSAIE